MFSYSQVRLVIVLLLLSGCQTAYYGALEKVGIHKRDLLVSRVESTRDSQQDAKQVFKSALEQFQSVVTVPPSELQSMYSELDEGYQASKSAADAVSQRIKDVESVSEALFDEWQAELSEYTNQSLRQSSEQQLKRTRQSYREMVKVMRRAQSSMQPVLNQFKDQVLYLKHNLNAQAIASLQSELGNIESDVARLLANMNQAIEESDQFIKQFQAG